MDIGGQRRALSDDQMKLPEVEKEVPRVKCTFCCAARTSIYLAGCVTFFALPINILSLSENAPYFGYNVTRESNSFRVSKLVSSALKGTMGWGSQTQAKGREAKETAAERRFRTRHLGMLAPDYSSAAAPEKSYFMEHAKALLARTPKVVTKVTPSAASSSLPANSPLARQQELSRFAQAEGRKTVPAALVYKQRSQDFLRQGRYLRYAVNLCDRFMYQAIPIAAVGFTHQILVGELMWSKSEKPLWEVNTLSTLLNLGGWVGGIIGCTLFYRRVLPRYNPALKIAVAEMMRYKKTASNLPYLVGSLRESLGVVEMVWAMIAYTSLYMVVTGVTEFILGAQYAMSFAERGDTSHARAPKDAAMAERDCGDSPMGLPREAPIGCFQKWVMNPVMWYYADWSSLCSPRWREWREVQLMRRKSLGETLTLDEAHSETVGSRGRLFRRTRVV